MMEIIKKFVLTRMLITEYYLYIKSAYDLFVKYKIDGAVFGCFIEKLGELLDLAEAALSLEKTNAKYREKDEADNLRDRLHGRLYNYLKYILLDYNDHRYADAQTIMAVVEDVGNPTRLPENVQSTVMLSLVNRLEVYNEKLEFIGARAIVDDMAVANQRFIAVEAELRELRTMHKYNSVPPMTELRKEIDPIFNAIIGAINGYCVLESKRDEYADIVREMNTLSARYKITVDARKRDKKEALEPNADNEDGE